MSESTFTWATVTATGPLRIRLDGDSSALGFTPESLVDPALLAVSDRVRVELANNRPLIIGASGGPDVVVVTEVPPGVMAPTALAAAPVGWLLCDGSAVSRSTYAALFAAVGTTFGAGNGSTTFNLPNLKGRVVVGIDTGQTEFDTRGETGGAKTHTHTLLGVIAAWFSGYYKNRSGPSWTATNSHSASVPGGASNTTTNGIAVEGSTDAGSTLQPYMALHYIIKT